MKTVKDETISALRESHSSQVAALRDRIETLKEQGSDQARNVRKDDMDTLERKLADLKKEKEDLVRKLDEAKRRNEEQIEKNSRLLQELPGAPGFDPAKIELKLKNYASNLKLTNKVLTGSNKILEGLYPLVVARINLPAETIKACGYVPELKSGKYYLPSADDLHIVVGENVPKPDKS